MRKILFILLLFPIFSFGQVVFNGITAVYNTLQISSTSINAVAGRLYILFVGTSNVSGTPATVTVTGTGQTWTEITNTLNNSGNRRITVFRFAPSSNNTNQVNINYTGTADGTFIFLTEVSGCIITGSNGSNAIIQSVTSSANGADPSITMATIGAGNAVIAMFINETNPGSATPESGWTYTANGGYATPDTGGYAIYKSITPDNTPSVTSASSNWGGIAIEIQSSLRRIIITN